MCLHSSCFCLPDYSTSYSTKLSLHKSGISVSLKPKTSDQLLLIGVGSGIGMWEVSSRNMAEE